MLNPRDFYDEGEERFVLIEALRERYPYPRRTYARMATAQLWAMYLRKEKPKAAREKPERECRDPKIKGPFDKGYEPYIKTIEGVTMIRKDSGIYEPLDEDDERR